MIKYDSNPPKYGNNQARAKQTLSENVTELNKSVIISFSTRLLPRHGRFKTNIHSSFTERKRKKRQMFHNGTRHIFFFSLKFLTKLRNWQHLLKMCWQLVGETGIDFYIIHKYSYRPYLQPSQYCWNEVQGRIRLWMRYIALIQSEFCSERLGAYPNHFFFFSLLFHFRGLQYMQM